MKHKIKIIFRVNLSILNNVTFLSLKHPPTTFHSARYFTRVLRLPAHPIYVVFIKYGS